MVENIEPKIESELVAFLHSFVIVIGLVGWLGFVFVWFFLYWIKNSAPNTCNFVCNYLTARC